LGRLEINLTLSKQISPEEAKMKRNLLIVLLILVISLVAVVPAFAHGAPPCNDSGDPGHSDYAKHHITFLAHNGDLGQVDHDGDGVSHVPGSHQGYSLCNPSGK
jgi:hypothetical protein